jgi:hypothetical protein
VAKLRKILPCELRVTAPNDQPSGGENFDQARVIVRIGNRPSGNILPLEAVH